MIKKDERDARKQGMKLSGSRVGGSVRSQPTNGVDDGGLPCGLVDFLNQPTQSPEEETFEFFQRRLFQSYLRDSGDSEKPQPMVQAATQSKSSPPEAIKMKCNWKPHLRLSGEKCFQKQFPTIAKEDVSSLIGCYNAIMEVYYIHGLKRNGDEKYLDQLCKSFTQAVTISLDYLKGKSAGFWIKIMKTKLANFYSAWYDQPLSRENVIPGSNPKHILGGVIYRFTRQLKERGDPQIWSSLLESILLAKKGMPRADKSLIEKAEENTVNALTSTKPEVVNFRHKKDLNMYAEHLIAWRGPMAICVQLRSPQDYLPELPYDHERGGEWLEGRTGAEHEIRRTVRELFGHTKLLKEELERLNFPSTSANYNRSRREAGQVGELTDAALAIGKKYPFVGPQLVDVELSTSVSEAWGAEWLMELEHEDESIREMATAYAVDVNYVKKCYTDLYWKTFDEAILEEPLVEPVGLAEALKIRVISKGPPKTYFVLKPLQQKLWKVLKNHRCFELVGKPVTSEIIFDALGIVKDREQVVSGDYQSSTDAMYSWCSEVAADELRDIWQNDGDSFFPDSLYQLLLKSLTGHIFLYKDIKRAQKNGTINGFRNLLCFPLYHQCCGLS